MRRLWPALLVPLTLSSMLLGGALAGAEDDEPLTLAVTANRETCTLGSVTTLDYDIQGGQPPYQLTVDGQPVEQSPDPHYIPCRVSSPWSRLGPPGSEDIQRMIVGVTDATGARAFAVAEHRLVRPLPAPIRPWVSSGEARLPRVRLTADWGAPYWPRNPRAHSFAIRWRALGAAEWQAEHYRPARPGSLTFRHEWEIETSPVGEHLELQVAQLHHVHDLQAPQALEWSRSAFIITKVPPQNLQAETTHDSIFLQWGPHVDGSSYGARLSAVEGRGSRYSQRLWLNTGPFFSARFTDLLPDTLYRIEVYLQDDDGWGYAREQHRFEIRTEMAPPQWERPIWSPTDVAASFIGDEMEVTWTPPETGSRFETTVCAEPPERAYARECEVVPAGETHALLPFAQRDGGGSFVVTVETRTTPPGTAEVELHVPTYEPDLLTQGPAADAPQFDAFRWGWHHEDPRPGSWTYVWDYQDGDLAEFSWTEGDRPITRESRSGWISVSTARGLVPEAVRMRLLRGGAWTPWSEQAHIPSVTRSLFPVRFVEHGDVLQLQWEAPADDTDVVGYRVYVARNDGAEEVLNVGRQTSVEIVLEPTDLVVAASVAALLDGSIEVGRSFTHWHHTDLPPDPLELTLTAENSPCPPAEQASLTIMWSISGGVPPFTLSVDDRLGFETVQRRGSTVVECRVGTDGLMQSIRGSVIDANRQEASHLLRHRQVWRHWYDEGAEPFDVNLGLRNVYRDRVLVAWTGCRGRFLAVLRWRPEESQHWSYIRDFPVVHRGDYWTCMGTLGGLAPLTTYEYQVARYVWLEQLHQPEDLQWTQTQSVTTLGEPQELSIAQDADTVVVSWQRQPDAWAYIVVLRSEDRSWWRRYEPNGEATEVVSFTRVPQGTPLSLELISPPLKDGKEEVPRGIDPGFSYGH